MLKNTLKVLASSAFLLSNSVFAGNLTVLNHNFDFDAIPPSPGYTTSITGWVNNGYGDIGVVAPVADGNDYTNVGGRAQVAYLNEGGRISQTISTSLVNDETYTLSFDVGQNLNQTNHNFVARVKAQGHVLAQLQSDSFTIPSGGFTSQTLQFTATSDMPIGQPVVVEFYNLATTTGQRVDLDNVTFATAGTGTDAPADNLGPFTMIMEDTTLLVPDHYPNINVALRYLDDKQIKAGKTVTIKVTDCTNQMYTESINVAHPNGDAIHFLGDTQEPLNCTLQFNGTSGFVVENGNRIGWIEGFNIVGDLTADTYGISASDGGMSKVGENTVVSYFSSGMYAHNEGMIFADGTYAHHNTKIGFMTAFSSTISARGAISSYNLVGFRSANNSSVYVYQATASNNSRSGFESSHAGYMYASQTSNSGNAKNYSITSSAVLLY